MADKWVRARQSILHMSLMEKLGVKSWGDLDHGKKVTIESMGVVDEDRAKRLGELTLEERRAHLEGTSDIDLIRMAGWAGDLERTARSFGDEESGGPAYSLSAPYHGDAPFRRGRSAALAMGGPLPGSTLATAPSSYAGEYRTASLARPLGSVPGFLAATRESREAYGRVKEHARSHGGENVLRDELKRCMFASDDVLKDPPEPEPRDPDAPLLAGSTTVAEDAGMMARFAAAEADAASFAERNAEDPDDDDKWTRSSSGAWSWRGREVRFGS